MFRLPTPSCPLSRLDTLDPAGVVAQVLRMALHAPAAWPLLREAMAYRCDPTGGPAAAEGLAELLALWRIHGRRPPRLHAPSDPDRAADEVAIAAALAEVQAGAPDRASRRLEWLFPARDARGAGDRRGGGALPRGGGAAPGLAAGRPHRRPRPPRAHGVRRRGLRSG